MQNMYNNAVGDWTGLGGSILTGAGNFFSSQEERKASQAQADALINKAQTDLEIAKINQQTKLAELEALKSGGSKNTSGNKTLYIVGGISAVVILGVVIFAVTRKK